MNGFVSRMARDFASTFKWALQMLAALVIALALLASATIGAIAALLAILAKSAAEALRLAGSTFVMVVFYLLCVGSPVASILWALPRLYVALGGDFAAILASAALALYPPVVVLAMRWGMGGLFLSGGLILVTGYVMPVSPPVVRSAIVTGIVASIVMFQIMKGEQKNEESRQHDTMGDSIAVTGIYGFPQRSLDPD